MCLLEVNDLHVTYRGSEGNAEAVRGMSYTIEPGEIVGLAGESGCGKTTAMMALMGMLPDSASVSARAIRLNGCDLTPPGEGKRERRLYEKKMETVRGGRIAMVFQDPMAFPDDSMRVGAQITETLCAHTGCTRKEAREEAERLLDLVGIRHPQKCMRSYPFELSGGICQRVVIAAALACRPELLIADEPTTALDPPVKRQILEVLRRAAEERNTAVMLVSHDPGVLACICQRILVMREGRIVEEGKTEDIFFEPEHPYTKNLLEQASRLSRPAHVREGKGTLLRLENVGMSYGAGAGVKDPQDAVEEVSFEIQRGETFGLAGESGCGKTTLTRLITGILKPAKGRITYRDQQVEVLSGWNRRRRTEIQMVFQNAGASLNPSMKAGKMLEEVLRACGKYSGGDRREKVREILEMAGLQPGDAEKYPHEFSGGQRQRLGIARALAPEPELVILDEATASLDLPMQIRILDMLKRIQEEREISYLLISHDLNVIRYLSRHMAVMYRGRLVETGNTEEICREPWHPYTKALLSSMLTVRPPHVRRQRLAFWNEEERKLYPEGCPYADRCGYAMECCRFEKPEMYCFGTRKIACFLYSKRHFAQRSPDYEMTVQI